MEKLIRIQELNKVRTAVIGIGNMGKHHARNYFEIDSSQLVAVSDLNEEIGAEISSKYACSYYKNYIEMIERERPQVVTIAVPSKYHHKVGTEVMSRGVHVLMEKPIAMTREEALDLIVCARDNQVKLMVGHIERFNPGVLKLKEIMDRGDLGNIISVITRRVGMFPPQIKDANVIIDLAVHDIDIINYLLGKEPNEVVGNGGRAILDNREDYAEIFLKYGETSGFIQVNWITPVKIRNISVTGTKGYAELNYITQMLQLFYSRYTRVSDNFGDFVINFGEPEKHQIEVSKKEPLRAELESFLDSVINGEPIVTTGENALKVLDIALKSSEIISSSR